MHGRAGQHDGCQSRGFRLPTPGSRGFGLAPTSSGSLKSAASSLLTYPAKPSSRHPASVHVPVDAIRRSASDRARDRSASSVVAIPIRRSPRPACGTGTGTRKSSAAGRRTRIATDRSSGTRSTDTARAVEPPERRLEHPALAHLRPVVASRCRATLPPDTPSRRLQSRRQPQAQQSPSVSFDIHYPSHILL